MPRTKKKTRKSTKSKKSKSKARTKKKKSRPKRKARTKKKAKSMNQLQEFLIAGFPKVSTKTAKRLLKHFKTPERIFKAEESELTKVEGIGKETARKIREILTKKYERSILED